MSTNPVAWLEQHRTAALAAGAAGVAGFALFMRHRSSALGAAPGAAATQQASQTLPTSDTTATDLYNSLEPILEGLYQQINAAGGVAASNPSTALDPTKFAQTTVNGQPAFYTGSGNTTIPIRTVSPLSTRQSESTMSTATAVPKRRATYLKGDTIWTFAKRYHISATQLLTLNSLPQSTRVIKPGTSLRVQL